MKTPKFIQDTSILILLIVVINFSLNQAFDHLKSTGHIQTKRAEGFSTWEIVGQVAEGQKNTPTMAEFPAEFGLMEEIKKKSSVTVLLGPSVVAGAGVAQAEKFPSLLNQQASSEEYFWNGGIDGAEIYSEALALKKLLSELDNIKTVIWFPNRNDLLYKKDYEARLFQVKEAKSLETDQEMKWQDLFFVGFFKRLAQRLTFEAHIRKDNYINSAHSIYYTAPILKNLDADLSKDLSQVVRDLKFDLDRKKIRLQVVFLPSRHINQNNTWEQALMWQDISRGLSSWGVSNYEFFTDFHGHDEFIDFVHFNSAGHRRIADLLKAKVLEKP